MTTSNSQVNVNWAERTTSTSRQSSRIPPEIRGLHSSCASSEDSTLPSISIATSLTSHDFIIAKAIGRGSSGTVYLARHACRPSIHAVKVVQKKNPRVQNADALVINEQRISRKLSEINSPFFLQLHASFHDTRNYYLVTPYVAAGDLAAEIRSILVPFSTPRVKFYMTELVHALSILHNLRIMHRDIKLQNIFIDTNGHIILGDFGLSCVFDGSQIQSYNPLLLDELRELAEIHGHSDHTRHWCGTVGYMAPELYLGLWYTYSADVWSLGVVMFEMLFNRMPWDGQTPRQIIDSTLNEPLVIPSGLPIDDDARDLLYSLLAKQPLERPDLGSVKNHPYFADVNWNQVANRKLKCKWLPTTQLKAVKPFSDKKPPLVIQTGLSYMDSPDPVPSFTYISPSARYLINEPDEQNTLIQSAVRTLKAAFSTPKLCCVNSPPLSPKPFRLVPINTNNTKGTGSHTQEPTRTPVMGMPAIHSKPDAGLSATPIASPTSPPSHSCRLRDSNLCNFTRVVKVKAGWMPSAKVRQGSDRRVLDLLE